VDVTRAFMHARPKPRCIRGVLLHVCMWEREGLFFWKRVLRTRRPDPNWFGQDFLLYRNEKNRRTVQAPLDILNRKESKEPECERERTKERERNGVLFCCCILEFTAQGGSFQDFLIRALLHTKPKRIKRIKESNGLPKCIHR
jgi:hypothetical protein